MAYIQFVECRLLLGEMVDVFLVDLKRIFVLFGSMKGQSLKATAKERCSQ